MTDCRIAELRARLLAWYDVHRRELPWRAAGGEALDPYHIWLSEAMLQQTRVDTVRSYYARWLERFPTLQSLADAGLDDVLKAWEGLGYYSRARNLHRAVREVRDRHGGKVPDDPDAFRALPGVGRYTAGAVMSIAFGREEPVVDGNVRRVLARWLDAPAPAEADLWRLAGRLVAGERPGCLNQALMELGALLCTPRSPRCDACPVSTHCAARAAGTQAERPSPRRPRVLPHENRVAIVVESEGHVLIARRPPRGRLGGMWEFPGGMLLLDEAATNAAVRVSRDALGISVGEAIEIARVDHTFTHLRVSYYAVRTQLLSGDARPLHHEAGRWVAPEQLRRFALPRAQQRIAALAFEPDQLVPSASSG